MRHAHKKVVSSKTHMQDSPGKRLGPKKYENHLVKIGQIIYRQRGTKWYPGFGCGIGKDHTIYAKEPGYVKYYLDPFHPKRKFIGIAQNKDDTLPYNHFEPTIRRFGRQILGGKKASDEHGNLPRKVQLVKKDILEQLSLREQKRQEKKDSFAAKLSEFVQEDGLDVDLASSRLVAIDGHLRGGKSLEDARFYSTYNYKYDLKLQLSRGELTSEEFATKIEQYSQLASKVDNAVMFDSKFQLTKNMTVEEIAQAKLATLAELDSLVGDFKSPLDKKTKAAVVELINKPFWTLKDQFKLNKKYLRNVLTEKNAVTIMKMNLETRRAEPFKIVKP